VNIHNNLQILLNQTQIANISQYPTTNRPLIRGGVSYNIGCMSYRKNKKANNLKFDQFEQPAAAANAKEISLGQTRRVTRSSKPVILYNSNESISLPPSPTFNLTFPPASDLGLPELVNMNEGDAAAAMPTHVTISGDGALLPSNFEGKPSEDAEAWLNYFNQYSTYKNLVGKPQQIELFKLLMKNQANDFIHSLPASETDTIDHIQDAFKNRYQQSELIRYRSARDIFSRKQEIGEAVDDYVTAMQKMARRVSENGNDDMTRFAIMAGLLPHIANAVVAKAPKTIAELLQAARIAELTAQPATDTPVLRQLQEVQAEVQKLSLQLRQNTTAAITRRSPTPERRERHVAFNDQQPTTQHSQQSQRPAYRPPANKMPPQHFAQQPPNTRFPQQTQFAPSCYRCGYAIHEDFRTCPALDPSKRCAYCNKQFHFAKGHIYDIFVIFMIFLSKTFQNSKE